MSANLASGHSWYPWAGEETDLFYAADHYRGLLALDPTYFSQHIVALLQMSDQTPLYSVVLNLWMHAFGTSVVALRSLPLLASVLSVPVMYALGRAVGSRRVGVCAATIFALAPFQIAFGLFNRPYAFLCFFSLCTTLAAVHLCRGEARARWLVVYAVAAILGFYTHYLFAWNVMFQIALVAWYQRHRRHDLRRFAATCVVVALVSLLWVPTFLAQIRWSRAVGSQSWFYWYTGTPRLLDAITSLGRNGLLLLTGGRVRGLCATLGLGDGCQVDSGLTVILYLIPLAILGWCGVQMARHFLATRIGERPCPDPWIVCAGWTAAVFIGPVLSDVLLKSHMVFSHRYFIAASGPVYLGVALAITRLERASIRRAVNVGLVAFLAIGSVFYIWRWSDTLVYEIGAREVAAHIDARMPDENDLILVLDPGLNPTDFAFYLQSNPKFARVDVPARNPSAPEIPLQLEQITTVGQPGRLWYLDDHGLEAAARDTVLDWLRGHFVQSDAWEFVNVGVYQFSRPSLAESGGLAR